MVAVEVGQAVVEAVEVAGAVEVDTFAALDFSFDFDTFVASVVVASKVAFVVAFASVVAVALEAAFVVAASAVAFVAVVAFAAAFASVVASAFVVVAFAFVAVASAIAVVVVAFVDDFVDFDVGSAVAVESVQIQ